MVNVFVEVFKLITYGEPTSGHCFFYIVINELMNKCKINRSLVVD